MESHGIKCPKYIIMKPNFENNENTASSKHLKDNKS